MCGAPTGYADQNTTQTARIGPIALRILVLAFITIAAVVLATLVGLSGRI